MMKVMKFQSGTTRKSNNVKNGSSSIKSKFVIFLQPIFSFECQIKVENFYLLIHFQIHTFTRKVCQNHKYIFFLVYFSIFISDITLTGPSDLVIFSNQKYITDTHTLLTEQMSFLTASFALTVLGITFCQGTFFGTFCSKAHSFL